MLAYTSQILLENAYESWQNAIQYAQYLYDGLATLNNKKDFVASLHNAVELFLKQIMINNNDHRVASIKSIDPDGEPLKSFYNSIDLNKYFIDTPSETRRKFYSIEFKDLLDEEKRDHTGLIEKQEPDGIVDTASELTSLYDDIADEFVEKD